MVDLQEFVRTELEPSSLARLYAGMLEGILLNRMVYSQTFNRFSIEIDFSSSTVVVEDDVFQEEEVAKMSISGFFELVNNRYSQL